MCNNRQWSLSLVGIVSIVLLAALFYLVGSSPVLAADAATVAATVVQQTAGDESWWDWGYIPLTNPWPIEDNFGNLLGTGVVQGQVEGRDDYSAEGQVTVQVISSLQLVFAHVEQILVDANQNPVGAVLSGRGTKNNNGRDVNFNFTFIVRRTPEGVCCNVQILAPEIHESGGIRFEGPGDLRFTSR